MIEFGVTAKVRSIAIKPPPNGSDRTESVHSAVLREVNNGGAPVFGKLALDDIPEEIARELAAGMHVGRRYMVTLRLVPVEDTQTKIDFTAAAGDGQTGEAADEAERTQGDRRTRAVRKSHATRASSVPTPAGH